MSGRNGWERGACRIVTTRAPEDGEPALAWFHKRAPGLAVVQLDPSEFLGRYSITHASSGRAIAKGFMRRADAQRGALAVAKLTDWTRTMDDLVGDIALSRLVSRALYEVAP
ncbi:MAG TPA: hypothetical protein VFK04_12790 [Gemmatimonadaceae bacterium]|nr:hypothetical protein [Gemmatimonadaceae bacterium]